MTTSLEDARRELAAERERLATLSAAASRLTDAPSAHTSSALAHRPAEARAETSHTDDVRVSHTETHMHRAPSSLVSQPASRDVQNYGGASFGGGALTPWGGPSSSLRRERPRRARGDVFAGIAPDRLEEFVEDVRVAANLPAGSLFETAAATNGGARVVGAPGQPGLTDPGASLSTQRSALIRSQQDIIIEEALAAVAAETGMRVSVPREPFSRWLLEAFFPFLDKKQRLVRRAESSFAKIIAELGPRPTVTEFDAKAAEVRAKYPGLLRPEWIPDAENPAALSEFVAAFLAASGLRDPPPPPYTGSSSATPDDAGAIRAAFERVFASKGGGFPPGGGPPNGNGGGGRAARSGGGSTFGEHLGGARAARVPNARLRTMVKKVLARINTEYADRFGPLSLARLLERLTTEAPTTTLVGLQFFLTDVSRPRRSIPGSHIAFQYAQYEAQMLELRMALKDAEVDAAVRFAGDPPRRRQRLDTSYERALRHAIADPFFDDPEVSFSERQGRGVSPVFA